jgi:hypothetical protein
MHPKSFDGFIDQVFNCLFKLCERTNKIIVTRAQNALYQLVPFISEKPKFCIAKIASNLKSNPNKTIRLISIEILNNLLKYYSSKKINLSFFLESVSTSISIGLSDACPNVRESSRAFVKDLNLIDPKIFEKFFSSNSKISFPIPEKNKLTSNLKENYTSSNFSQNQPVQTKPIVNVKTTPITSIVQNFGIGKAQRLIVSQSQSLHEEQGK